MTLRDRVNAAWAAHLESGESFDIDLVETWLPDPSDVAGRRIGEVAGEVGISAHAIRYYERLGLLDVPRDENGERRYDAASLGRLMFVVRMRGSGMPVRELQQYFGLLDGGGDTAAARLALLTAHRSRLLDRIRDLELSLAVTDHKIARHSSGTQA